MSQEIHDSNSRKYFHMMPNITDDDLDLYEYRLYGHYLRVCGAKDNGVCKETERTTYKVCGMSRNKFRATRQSLADKGFIKIVQEGIPHEKGKPGQPTIIAMCDVWYENVSRYSGKGSSEDHSKDNGSPENPLGGERVHQRTLKGSSRNPKKKEERSKEQILASADANAPRTDNAESTPSESKSSSEKVEEPTPNQPCDSKPLGDEITTSPKPSKKLTDQQLMFNAIVLAMYGMDATSDEFKRMGAGVNKKIGKVAATLKQGYKAEDVPIIHAYCKRNFDNFSEYALSTHALAAMTEHRQKQQRRATQRNEFTPSPQDEPTPDEIQAALQLGQSKLQEMRREAVLS